MTNMFCYNASSFCFFLLSKPVNVQNLAVAYYETVYS